MVDRDDILKRLDAAITYVELAQSELALDNIVMLNELQTNVARICAEIADLPIGELTDFREKLSTLAEKMQLLEVDLRAKKIVVERELKSASRNKTATSAYEKAKGHSSTNEDKK